MDKKCLCALPNSGKRSFKKMQGMTLLEVIIVLGIMGIIAAGVVVLAQRAIDNQNVQRLSQALNTMQTGMVQTYRSQQSYPAIGTDAAASGNLIKALTLMGRISDQDAINLFTGEPVNIFTLSNNGKANRAFALSITGLTQDQCSAIVSGSNDLFEFIQVVAAGGTLVADAYVDPAATAGLGVLKSTKGGADTFDITNLTHVTSLCGGAAGAAGYYDLFLGNR